MTLQELEKAILGLDSEDLAKFRAWFSAFDAKNWDQQFEADVASGRLDAFADEAVHEHRSGKSTKL